MNWTPHRYQLDAVKFVLNTANCGILLDPGMGKTSISLAVIEHLLSIEQIKRVLIIAPIRPMYKVWPDEIRKWTEFQHLSYTILHGDAKDANLNRKTHIYLLNPEGLKWFLAAGGIDKIGTDMLIVDESTKFKDSQTARFKLLKPYLHRFLRRLILTGEPVPNGYMDLFGQCYIMDQGNALGRFITHYRAHYFYPSGYGGYTFKLQDGAKERIQERIRHQVMRLAAEDHLDMPKLLFNDIIVDLPPEARTVYKQFEKDFIAEVGEATILAPNGAAAGSKCRQVANGGVYDEAHFAHHVHDAKTAAAADLVEQLQGRPVFMLYEFQHDLARLKRAFPDAPCLTGMTGGKLDATITAFNAGDVPVLLGHPASAGHGLNIQESCHHVCFYGITWDLDLYHQAYKRIWRQGQPSNRVFVHRIIADKTLDRVVVRELYDKEGTQTDFLNAIRSERE